MILLKNKVENLHKKFAKSVYIMYNIYKEDRREDLREKGGLPDDWKRRIPIWKNEYLRFTHRLITGLL